MYVTTRSTSNPPFPPCFVESLGTTRLGSFSSNNYLCFFLSPSGIPESEREAKRASVITQLTEEEIKRMRVTCTVRELAHSWTLDWLVVSDPVCFLQLAREVMDIAARAVRLGVTTDEIDRLVHEVCFDIVLYYYLSMFTNTPNVFSIANCGKPRLPSSLHVP